MKRVGFLAIFLTVFAAFGQYSSTYEMNKARKFGIGPLIGGSYGKWGVKFDLNVEEDDGVVAGVGGSDSYNSFNMAWKHDFDGGFTHFYSVLGYAKLFGNSSPRKDEYLVEQLQSTTDSDVSQDLTVGGFGFQYNELGEEFTGLSVFMEADLLHAWKTSKLIPTGSVGVTYYF